ncbi:MAG: RtcB family protein [Candidatus Zixiibacteriota bacterium]
MNTVHAGDYQLKKISDWVWEIPQAYRSDMRVPARIYASREMLESTFHDRTLKQLVNVATLPGIQGAALVMPDAHEGYGFPIGGVAATEFPDGIISPGGIGYDINCGVRLLFSRLHIKDVVAKMEKLSQKVFENVPSGVGKSGRTKLTVKELDEVLCEGVKWAVKRGFATEEDQRHIESSGFLRDADPRCVSLHSKERGKDQLGTMGAGNHFVEIDRIDEIFDEKIAKKLGLFPSQCVLQIHTGSRGLGHQVATDALKVMMRVMPKYGISLPDRELAGVPLSSKEGQDYFKGMCAAANFAWTNRQLISNQIREAWLSVMGESGGHLNVLYDVAHNIAKIESYQVNGKDKKLIVHRKGATRAFPPHHPDVPELYRDTGQPVLIPGSMGTASYVLTGTEGAMRDTFGSTCHGAGRAMSRTQARKLQPGKELLQELLGLGVTIQAKDVWSLPEEAPYAYKDVESVVDVVHNAGIAKKIARMKPLAVIKG